MREIKFRAWDTFNACYYYSDRYTLSDFFSRMIVLSDADNGIVYEQYTGLKDKNGKEIYEGDILKAIDVLLTVWYNDATASFDVLHYGDETGDTESLYSNIEAEIPLEVIGNIYENPELCNQ